SRTLFPYTTLFRSRQGQPGHRRTAPSAYPAGARRAAPPAARPRCPGAPDVELPRAVPRSPVRELREQAPQLLRCQVAPLPGLERAELDVVDAHAAQLGDAVTEGRGHQPDL